MKRTLPRPFNAPFDVSPHSGVCGGIARTSVGTTTSAIHVVDHQDAQDMKVASNILDLYFHDSRLPLDGGNSTWGAGYIADFCWPKPSRGVFVARFVEEIDDRQESELFLREPNLQVVANQFDH